MEGKIVPWLYFILFISLGVSIIIVVQLFAYYKHTLNNYNTVFVTRIEVSVSGNVETISSGENKIKQENLTYKDDIGLLLGFFGKKKTISSEEVKGKCDFNITIILVGHDKQISLVPCNFSEEDHKSGYFLSLEENLALFPSNGFYPFEFFSLLTRRCDLSFDEK